LTIEDVAEEVREIEERRRQAVKNEVVNRVLRAPENTHQSKREMLGLDKKRRHQKAAPLFEEKGLFEEVLCQS